MASKAVGVGTERTSVVSSRLSCLGTAGLHVSHLVELPEASKALLAAEKGRRQFKLDAGRALHRRGLRAVWSGAGLLVCLLRQLFLGFYHCLLVWFVKFI